MLQKQVFKYFSAMAGLLLLLALNPAFAGTKDRILKVDVTVVDLDKSDNPTLNGATIELIHKHKVVSKLVSQGATPVKLQIPINKEEYEIDIKQKGYLNTSYFFSGRDFDFSVVEDNEGDYIGKFIVILTKLPEGQKTGDAEAKELDYNPRTHMLDSKKYGQRKEAPKTHVDYIAKFMITRKNKSQPEGLANGNVLLQDTTGNTLNRTKTNNSGEFSFHHLDPDKKYNVVLEKSKDIPDDAKIYMAKPNGTVIQKLDLDKSTGSFQYKLLPAELTKLTAITEEDASIKVMNFSKSTLKEINIVQYIYYDVNKWDVSPEAAKTFDEIAEIMTSNPTLKLEVGSHTDSNGDDDYNMKLSEKRASTAVAYLIAKGIDRSRVTGKGYGETKILNRCKNGVTCFEEEHAQNRRTEFRFIKP